MRKLIFVTLMVASATVFAQAGGWWPEAATVDESRFVQFGYNITCHSVGPDNRFYAEYKWLTKHQADEINRTGRVDWIDAGDNPQCEAVRDLGSGVR